MPVRGLRGVLPLYLVVFVGFLGYRLMIATFTPMILRDGMLATSSDLALRSLVVSRRPKPPRETLTITMVLASRAIPRN